MKVIDFLTKHKIRPAFAAGFKASLRVTDDHDLPEDKLVEAYKNFTGRTVDGKPVRPDARIEQKKVKPAEGAAKAAKPELVSEPPQESEQPDEGSDEPERRRKARR